VSSAVHRIVEQRAATTPDAVAILDGARATTYRELNQMANTLARRFCESGLTRGSLALVRMPRGSDLAAVLLAVLKAGASYGWVDPGSPEDVELPAKFCVLRKRVFAEEQYLALEIENALRDAASRPGPNLPVLTRDAEVACVLPDVDGRPHVLVPHATITALPRIRARHQVWEGCAGALDLWVALMSGITLSVDVTSQASAAA
jgi:acyl-CoA synthetase (AMP-forming)/AMP-acid ligase II